MTPGPGRLLAGAVVLLVGMLALRETASLLVPVVIGLFLALTASPLIRSFERRGAPRVVGVTAAVASMLGVVVATVVLVGVSLAQLLVILPRYADRLAVVAADVERFMGDLGVEIDPSALPSLITPGMLAEFGQSILAAVSQAAASLLVVVLALVFGLSGAGSMRLRAEAVLGGGHPLLGGLVGFGADLRRYILVRAQLGAFAAVLSFAWLLVLGVPLPLLWALLVFAASFVPNIGMFAALVPPAVLALLDSGLGAAAAVVIGFALVNLAQDYILQPRLMGTEFNLNPLVVLLAIVAWSWILGAAGALLAVPLTVGLARILETFPESEALAGLMRNSLERDRPGASAGSLGRRPLGTSPRSRPA